MKYFIIIGVFLLTREIQSINAQVTHRLPFTPTTMRQNDAPVNVLSQMPEYPGGEESLNLYIRNNLDKAVVYYYTKDRPFDIRKPTIVSFIVRADGSLSNIRIKQCPTKGVGNQI